MKEANRLLFWIIGIPMMWILVCAMAEFGQGTFIVMSALACVGIGLLFKNRKENK